MTGSGKEQEGMKEDKRRKGIEKVTHKRNRTDEPEEQIRTGIEPTDVERNAQIQEIAEESKKEERILTGGYRIREVFVKLERISYFGPNLGNREESEGTQAPEVQGE